MKRKIYWKDILRSFASSKGRFLSILILMMLGSLALVGLKIAPPNMRRTATDYLKEQRTMDLAVMADYGLDAADQKELEAIKGADVEFGYLTDVTVDEEANVTLDMTLTSPTCPLTDRIEYDTKYALDGLANSVTINWVWLPPWTLEMITEDGREQLRAIGYNL